MRVAGAPDERVPERAAEAGVRVHREPRGRLPQDAARRRQRDELPQATAPATTPREGQPAAGLRIDGQQSARD